MLFSIVENGLFLEEILCESAPNICQSIYAEWSNALIVCVTHDTLVGIFPSRIYLQSRYFRCKNNFPFRSEEQKRPQGGWQVTYLLHALVSSSSFIEFQTGIVKNKGGVGCLDTSVFITHSRYRMMLQNLPPSSPSYLYDNFTFVTNFSFNFKETYCFSFTKLLSWFIFTFLKYK